jgi:hypothetical protein
MFSRFIPVTMHHTYVFQSLNNISLCGCTTFYSFFSFMFIWDCFCFYHMTNATMCICVQVVIWTYAVSFLLALYLGIELLGHTLTLYFNSWGTANLLYPIL